MLRFDNKVAVVTGAGGGLGRAYALALAERGAAVVVNDLGGSGAGVGSNKRPAEQVVAEIRAKGGKAVPDFHSVENGEAIIKTAIDNFGRVDIVINNAGILRDKSFTKMSTDDWNVIQRIHLFGAFSVTRAAWPYMREQKYGKIILTASSSGIYGNFGQANYSAAKLGLVGFGKTLAIEGERAGISTNVIVPVAASRLTQDVLPQDMFDKLKPEFVAPVVLWLCHEKCSENGGVFEAAGGSVAKYLWHRSQGLYLHPITVETVVNAWPKITDMSNGIHPSSSGELTGILMEKISQGEDGGGGTEGEPLEGIHREVALGHQATPSSYEVTPNAAIMYALSVGVSLDKGEKGLRFLYENHPDFAPLPTFIIVPCQHIMFDVFSGGVPGLSADFSRFVHGEQYLEITSPKALLPTSGEVETRMKIVEILNKGSGVLIVVNADCYEVATGQRLAFLQFSLFGIGITDVDAPRSSSVNLYAASDRPNRPADATFEYKTSVDQAAFYRLNGDTNPLHIDPNMSILAGFKTPILHGLCFMGIVAQQILLRFANGDPSSFMAIKVRFAGPVIPGQTLVTEAWLEMYGRKVVFETKVRETGKPAIKGGYMMLNKPAVQSAKL